MSAGSSSTLLWQPLGPHTLLGGEPLGATRVTGRISMLAVHEDGERVYAASANGGVWYSGDAGANWRSLDGLADTPGAAAIDRPAHRLACGAIAVRFGSGGAPDTVIVGTGEPWHAEGVPADQRTHAQPGQPFGGVGILIGTHQPGPPGPGSITWVREAANLVGHGVYRIALQPGGTRIVAATTAGLFEQPALDAGTAWKHVLGAPFDELDADCSDVLWTAADGGLPPRLWAWVARGANAGLWVAASNVATPEWRRIETPGSAARRAVLAAATPQEVWLLCDHPGDVTRPAGDTAHPASAAPRAASDCDCWFRRSPDRRQGFVQLIESLEVRSVSYRLMSGRAIFEGDIDLGSEAEMEALRTAVKAARAAPGAAPAGVLRGIVHSSAARWPGGLVAWETTPALRDRVERAIAHWESRTRIRFVERTPANQAFYPNWVSFEPVKGCSSPVGMRGGKQVVSLTDGCEFGATVHEIGHSLGLWHEQSREDRNAHVRVQTENIEPDELDNFDQHITDGDDVGAYDYASIMHYSRKAFSKNGEDTIVPLGGQSIGQRDGLSAGDVAAIRSIYPDLERPLLFRIGGGADPATLVARAVLDVPGVLGRTGHAAIALAVHPTLNQRVLLGGARHAFTDATGSVRIPNARGRDDAALLAADVAAGAGGQLHVGGTPMSLGAGVYPFVHHIVFSNSGNRLWVASDGGIYRSQPASQRFGFAALAGGVRAHEANAIAPHPQCEGRIVASLQGHGIAERQSGAAWRCVGSGEGGGAAFDPTQPERFVHQVERGRWRSSDEVLTLSLPRGEDDAARCARYSTPALVTHERPGAPAGRQRFTQVIIGGSRLWYSEDFGTSWVTLPGGTPPPAGNLDHDAFGQPITVCRWQGSEVAWVLGEGRLRRYARNAGSDVASGPGTWTVQTILERTVKPKKDETKANGPIRDAAAWTELAVNLEPPPAAGQPPAVRGTRGAVYLGTLGKAGKAEVDTLWWFDGNEHWFATGLRAAGVNAPVTAIACDPAFPNEVWVGTTIGVWKGTRNLANPDAPSWTWSALLNGLPEAAVQDLVLFSDAGLRLLRAAIVARGVWELRLDQPEVPTLAYLRAHDDDLRHRDGASLLARDGSATRAWHASPDLRPRRAAVAATTPATLPWMHSSPQIEPEPLRRFQSALRARSGDARVRATGIWDAAFDELLVSLGAPVVNGLVRIDRGFWELNMSVPFALAEPWGTAQPGSADLIEFSAEPRPGSDSAASCELPPGPSVIDVLVQHRGLAPMDGGTVRVTLLMWADPAPRPSTRHDDESTWPAGDVPWTGAVNHILNSTPGTTTLPLGAGWSLVGSRQTLTGQTLDALRPGIASFALDLTAVPQDHLVLLVAVVRAGADDVALAPAPLRDLVLANANLAVRSLRITGTSVNAPAIRNPFPTVHYALQLQPGATHNARLATALATERAALGDADKTRLDKVALIVARLTPAGTMEYAGVHETEMYFSASLLKVAMLYASFELEAQVNQLATDLPAPTAAKFLERVRLEFGKTIERSVARINRPGEWRTTKFKEVLRALPDGPNRFRVELHPTHAADLGKIFTVQDKNIAPRDTMHRLGYSYVNRALEAAGFFNAASANGIWTTADYGSWPDFHVPVATRGGRPERNGSSSAAMTALAMASLLAHLQRGTLVDAAASARMRTIFQAGADWSWMQDFTPTAAASFTVTGCKIGESPSGSAFVGNVYSEGAWLRRKSDAAEFVLVWQNVHESLPFPPIFRAIDAVVRNWP